MILVKHMNRMAARVPIWLAAVLLAVPMVTLARWGLAEVQRGDSARGQVVATAEALEDAQANTTQVKRELAKQKIALARANQKLKAVGETPVDPDETSPTCPSPASRRMSGWSTWAGPSTRSTAST